MTAIVVFQASLIFQKRFPLQFSRHHSYFRHDCNCSFPGITHISDMTAIAVFQSSLIFQSRFPEELSYWQGQNTVSTSCPWLHIATKKKKISKKILPLKPITLNPLICLSDAVGPNDICNQWGICGQDCELAPGTRMGYNCKCFEGYFLEPDKFTCKPLGKQLLNMTIEFLFRIRIQGRFTCKSKNVIYVLSCTKCGLQYVGQTGNTFNEHYRAHLTDIRQRNVLKPVSLHFTSTDHSVNNVVATIVTQKTSNINVRLRTEESWINLLQSRQPSGLNLKQ